MKNLAYYMSLPYRLEIIPDKMEGGYVASFPELPGCITCADTLTDVLAMASDAKTAWIEAALEDGNKIPEPVQKEYSGQFKLRIPKSLHKNARPSRKRRRDEHEPVLPLPPRP